MLLILSLSIKVFEFEFEFWCQQLATESLYSSKINLPLGWLTFFFLAPRIPGLVLFFESVWWIQMCCGKQADHSPSSITDTIRVSGAGVSHTMLGNESAWYATKSTLVMLHSTWPWLRWLLLLLLLFTFIYSAILCSRADSLCSHVIL